MIEVKNLRFSYGKRLILDDLSFRAEAGECVVLAGANGSGKTTALSLIAGVLREDEGSVECRGRIGFVPQGTALFEDMSVNDNLRFFARLARCAVPKTLPFGVERYGKMRVGKLSGGMKKQVSIACALLGDPDILLLDEPCASLDIEYREELIGLIRDLKAAGRTVLYVSHEPMEFASCFDRLVFLGTQNAVLERAELIGEGTDYEKLYRTFASLFGRGEKKGETL